MPLLAGLGPLGLPELLIIAFIVVLIFGVGRLPDVGGAVGKSIREFRKATKDEEHTDASAAATESAPAPSAPAASAPQASDTVFCGECGTRNPRGAKFCSNCGHAISAPVR
jgi:sec-independent protein translocase protein TatA